MSKNDKADQRPGTGGELHQSAGADHPVLTTNQGVALSDDQNSLRANPRGPTLLEDFILRDKITHFDHERIPERIVHARGTGVHGFFELHRVARAVHHRQTAHRGRASRRRCSRASRPWPAGPDRSIRRATCEVSP